MNLDPSSRARLNAHHLPRFTGPSLFDRVARVVCSAECLPRKELYESWEVARRTRRRFRGGRVVDLACGHGLIAHLMVVLDDTSPRALAVDRRLPPSASRLANALVTEWPRLESRIELRQGAVETVELTRDDVVVSSHACGALTDKILTHAIAVRARIAVLPCCHDQETCDTGGLEGWLDAALAIDTTRVALLRASGYAVLTQSIPAAITPKNRLILAAPI